ncbi:MAG TPA: SRPBCC domain-containing protein [Aridibacter sp.]|nr:SRPBCC domain-containing protein [Aridibacter sp.]
MPDIFHQFPVFAPANEVFDAVSTPQGLDAWWTLTSKGEPAEGNVYELFFGKGYDWRARVTACVPNEVFELEIYDSMPDWDGTRVRFELTERASVDDVSDFPEAGTSEDDNNTTAGSASSAGSAAPEESAPSAAETMVRFSHTGWPEDNDHYRTSSFCWAMYLRLMKKWVDEGTVVEYGKRLDA